MAICRGFQSAADCATEFRILASESGCNEAGQKTALAGGLSEELRNQLSTRDEPESFERLISLVIRTDNCIRERR